MSEISPSLYCSFCDKGQKDVRDIITGPGTVAICNECIDLCNEILEIKYAESDVLGSGKEPDPKVGDQ